MIKLYINDTDRTDKLRTDSISISEAVDSRNNTCSLILEDYRPTENQNFLLYNGLTLVSGVTSGSDVVCTLKYTRNDDFNQFEIFRIGDTVIFDPEETNEETAEITDIDTANETITVNSLSSNHAAGVFVGVKIFGGIVNKVTADILDYNDSYVTYNVEAIEWSRKMDRKLVNNIYSDRTVQYIIINILNNYVNYNHLIEDFEYSVVGDLRSEWIESGDGDDPTRETTDFKEGDTAAEFPWTNSGGTATFSATPASTDISDITGVNSGAPTNGTFRGWFKNDTNITSIKVRLGSDSSNYTELDITPSSDWPYAEVDLSSGSETGTPDWTAFAYCAVVITETGDGSVLVDDFRINANGYFTFNGMSDDTPTIDDVRFSFKEPSLVIERLASIVGWHWYVDYDQDIKFFEQHQDSSPFNLTDTSENYGNLNDDRDVSQLVNTVFVRGGTESSSTQTETYVADGEETVFFIGESPRTTGFSDENDRAIYDYTLAIDTGAGFGSEITPGIIGVDDATANTWMLNPKEKYVTNGTASTLSSGDKIRHTYTYNVPILVKAEDGAAIASLASVLGGDGIIEHAITESKLKSSTQAQQFANSYLVKYGSALKTLTFQTDYEGLEVGQIITITNTALGYSSEQFLIQRIDKDLTANNQGWVSNVTCSTTYFGLNELFKLLLDEDFEIDEGQTIGLIQSGTENLQLSDSGSSATLGSTTFTWGPDASAGIWNEFQWS